MRERRTMAELTGIITSLFVMLLIDFPETGQVSFNYIDVRDGDDVTLSCEHVKSDQDKCDKTDWLFSFQRRTVFIIKQGQIHNGSKSKSDRLSVTENCSLVLKKVTVEDVGRYTCRQFDTSGREQGPDSVVDLSVVTMTEQKLHDKVTFSCQVFRHVHCHQSVKWLFQDKDVDQNNKDLQTSQTVCYATVTFLDSHFIYSSRFKLFKCEVTNTVSGKVQKFSFRRQSSGEETGQDTTTTTTTTKPTTTTTKPTKTTTTTTTNDSTNLPDWGWGLIAVTVSLAALVIIVLLVQRYKRRTGKKTQTDENAGLSLNTAGTQSGPETSQDTADPEDGVSYASVSYTRKTKSKAQVHNEDEDDAVTYSTVKVSSSSAADPSSLYASIN
ncbi:uncharacterized protein LOC113137077 isoform X2 [Mastacembelus armatus]|uniref:uncharacterized protein LOC113137077 isoform X2 n=1 Tax=Mastacembelus armatus TaxID=205130 RepID=UPI000E45BB85|nr:uncharacterized protein LOC113137077 isoform X2 [Mastacembelus armatus]